jgi:type VI secretion system protein VasD
MDARNPMGIPWKEEDSVRQLAPVLAALAIAGERTGGSGADQGMGIAMTLAFFKYWRSISLVLAGSLTACGSPSPPPAAINPPATPQPSPTAADLPVPPPSPAPTPSPPPPTVVELTFSAADDVNPEPSGRASPIAVRYYQLSATGTFESVDYFQIHDKEAAVLGEELLDRHDLAIVPGATRKVSIDAKPAAKAFGVIASYRDIDAAQWRADVPIPANQTTRLKVQLDKLKLAIIPEE